MGREKWVDSIRFISIEIIFGVHFIAACAPDMSKLWHEGVTGMILCGISGKLAVAMFSVLLGYFAARAGAKADFSMSRYMCRRYIKFSVAIFGILALLAMLSFSMKALGGGTNGANMATANFLFGIPALSLKNILLDAFFFEVNVFPLLWCMKDFFLCSIISAAVISISGIENIKRLCGVWAGIILLCCLTGNVWLAIGLLGACLLYTSRCV